MSDEKKTEEIPELVQWLIAAVVTLVGVFLFLSVKEWLYINDSDCGGNATLLEVMGSRLKHIRSLLVG